MKLSKEDFERIKKNTLRYKGSKYAFNQYCKHCTKTVFTNSQIYQGSERNKNEQLSNRDWITLCTNCWEVIDCGLDDNLP